MLLKGSPELSRFQFTSTWGVAGALPVVASGWPLVQGRHDRTAWHMQEKRCINMPINYFELRLQANLLSSFFLSGTVCARRR